jgi:WD40 repeat protein
VSAIPKPSPVLTGRCYCSLKVWQLGSSSPNFTLEGHEKGVNCIDYYSGGDKPYLISGADDRLVKIWDYQVQFFIIFLAICYIF